MPFNPLTSLCRLRPAFMLILALALALALPATGRAQGEAGPYLATRLADDAHDFEAVVTYGTRALARDPGNTWLMESLIVAEIGLGQVERAVPIARRLAALEPANQIAGLVLLAEAIHDENWSEVLRLQEDGLSIGPVMDQVLGAWAKMGEGRMSEALDDFARLAASEDAGTFGAYHQAMARALAGDYEGAAEIFAGAGDPLGLDRAAFVAYVEILSQLERFDEALELLERGYPREADAEIEHMRAELAAGRPVPFTVMRGPRDGAADSFFSVAQSLVRELDPSIVLLYARIAQYLRPDMEEARVLSGSLLELLGRFELATKAYSGVAETSRLYLTAQRARASALRRQGKADEAVALLEELTASYPDAADLWEVLGDTLRFQRKFDAAAPAYSRAIELIEARGEVPASAWGLYFHRGICNEQLDRWKEAEADFRRALELNPDQPMVLNYLGYSYVEMKTNLDEALKMIELAVSKRPNDGYITDSLGWVLFRLGRYDEAVTQMERAVELNPVDPVLNDHLGDTYWAVGRKREAEFQWKRALSFITDKTDLSEIDPDRIRRKLEVGLDKVLEEEGAPPLHAADGQK